MELPYNDTDDDLVATYRRVHANGEQTHVAVLSAGSNDYVAVAYDIDPRDYVPVAAECVAFDPTLEGVCERARRWMQQHPKGVAGADESGEGGGSGGRMLGAVMQMGKKLNDYGNQQMHDIQNAQQQNGGQQ